MEILFDREIAQLKAKIEGQYGSVWGFKEALKRKKRQEKKEWEELFEGREKTWEELWKKIEGEEKEEKIETSYEERMSQ